MIVTLPKASMIVAFHEPLHNNCGRKSELCFDSQCLKSSLKVDGFFWIN